jgi:hypothetical protein
LFARLTDEGHLHIDDPALAAEHFLWLVLSSPLNRAMLLGDDDGVTTDDLDRYADAGVSAFLAAQAGTSDQSVLSGRSTIVAELGAT